MEKIFGENPLSLDQIKTKALDLILSDGERLIEILDALGMSYTVEAEQSDVPEKDNLLLREKAIEMARLAVSIKVIRVQHLEYRLHQQQEEEKRNGRSKD